MNATALRTLTEVLGFRSEPGREFSNLEKPAQRLYQHPNAGIQFAVDLRQVKIAEKPGGSPEFSLDRSSLWRIDSSLHKATIKFDRIGEGELLKAIVGSGRVQGLLIGQSGPMEFKVRGVIDQTGEKVLDWERHARGLTVAKPQDHTQENATILAALRFAQQNDASFRQFAAANGFGLVDSGGQIERLAENLAAKQEPQPAGYKLPARSSENRPRVSF